MQKGVGGWVLVVSLCLVSQVAATTASDSEERAEIAVGVILDLNSSPASMLLASIRMALHDFYSNHPHYSTRLLLQIRDSGNHLLTAASAARDLINNEKVHAILGPQNSEQARFVVELGDKAQVPVIWFSPSGPSLLPPRSHLFISTIQSRCFQFKAIAAIIEAFSWRSVIPIYEDPEFGNDLIPCLTYALKDIDTQVHNLGAIDPHSKDDEITKELHRLKDMQTRVFVVHMTVDLGSKLLKLARKAGMMSEGYAWILTQGLSSLTDPNITDRTLGLRPIFSERTNERTEIESRFKERYNDSTLTLYGWWAYDTITALAIAIESKEAGRVTTSTSLKTNRGDNAGIGMNDTGPKLLNVIKDTDFIGQTEVFSLSQGRVEPSVFEVYYVNEEGESIIGYWSPERGLVRNNKGVGGLSGKYKVNKPTWSVKLTEKPPKLRIGVPKTHFTEFIDVNEKGQDILPNGFAIDVLKNVLAVLSFPSPEFVALKNKSGVLTPWTYDELLCQIEEQKVDAIIGDITIVANRTTCVDFTLPYLDSSVSMVVMVRPDSKSRWILFKPFDLVLWLILGVIFVGATTIVIRLERNKNANRSSKFKGFIYNPFLIYKSDIKDLSSGTSRWMVILVTFLLIIVVQVYTANLTSMLTERAMPKPSSLKDIQEIKRKKLHVGYQRDSWVRGLLIEQIGFPESHLKDYGTLDEYYKALSDGNNKGGVYAIFDETPYLNLFLSKYNSYFTMAGPIYKTGGFAFAFRKNSSLVSNFSAAILNVTQSIVTFQNLTTNISFPTTIDNSEYKSGVERRSLKMKDFGVLFPVVFCVLALFLSLLVLKSPFAISWLHEKFSFIY